MNWHVLGRSGAVGLRVSSGLVHRGGRLRYSRRSVVIDGCQCRIRLVHGGRAGGVLLADLLLASSGTTRSPEQAPKHTRRGRLLLDLTIGSSTLSSDFAASVLFPAEGSKQRRTALLLDGVRSRGTSCASRTLSGCLETSIGGRYGGGRTAAGSGWGPSRQGGLFAALLGFLFSFDLFLLL